MDLYQKIYHFSKQRQIVEEKVTCFVKKMTEVQYMVKEASLIFLIEKSQRLLVHLQKWEGRILSGLSSKKLTMEEVHQECQLLSRINRLYLEYASEYNELLQTLLCEKYQNKL